jgi:hypothetical protein
MALELKLVEYSCQWTEQKSNEMQHSLERYEDTERMKFEFYNTFENFGTSETWDEMWKPLKIDSVQCIMKLINNERTKIGWQVEQWTVIIYQCTSVWILTIHCSRMTSSPRAHRVGLEPKKCNQSDPTGSIINTY